MQNNQTKRLVSQMLKKASQTTLNTAMYTLNETNPRLTKAQQSNAERSDENGSAQATAKMRATTKQLAINVNQLGRASARRTYRQVRDSGIIKINTKTINRGSNGIKTATASVVYPADNINRARKAYLRAQQASKLTVHSSKAVLHAVKEAVGAIVNTSTAIIGGAWLMGALLVSVVLLIGFMGMFQKTHLPTGPNVDYNECTEAVYLFLRNEMGLNSAATAGVMANIQCESGFNINALGDNGTSFGLCQWHNNRWDRLESFCVENGYIPDLEGQLFYLKHELENYYPSILNHLQNVEDSAWGCYDAAEYFCVHFERPLDAHAKGAQRGELAVTSFWYEYPPLF